MIQIALSVLPLVLVLGTGYGFARSGLIPRDSWPAIEALSFRILIPAILITAIGGSDLSFARFGGFVTLLVAVIAALSTLAFVLRLVLQLPNAQFSSVYQGIVRWNAFVALAAGTQFMEPDALAVMGVALAVTIPLINVLSIVVASSYGPSAVNWTAVWQRVLKNPLVQACAIGLALNLSGVELPLPVTEALSIMGAGAIGVGLLAVGAGISLRRLARWQPNVLWIVLGRPLLGPVLFWAVGQVLGLPPDQLFVGVLVFVAPSAANGYIIARQMGGDAELYADAMTWQVALSLLVLPLWVALLG